MADNMAPGMRHSDWEASGIDAVWECQMCGEGLREGFVYCASCADKWLEKVVPARVLPLISKMAYDVWAKEIMVNGIEAKGD